MVNWIAAEVSGQGRIGWIHAFGQADGLEPGTPKANLNGIIVGLKWKYGDVLAVIFHSKEDAQRWPTGLRLDAEP